jgi:hypothetical protein
MGKIIHLHNDTHLGDNVFNFILFYNIKDYLKENDITIFYYALPCYLPQLKEFIPNKHVALYEIAAKPENSLRLWIGNSFWGYTHSRSSRVPFNKFYIIFFNLVLNKLGIPITLTRFFYQDPDLLYRYEKLNDEYKKLDILIINSNACSGQFSYSEPNWCYLINKLSQKYKITTTKKIDNVLSTTDAGLTIKDIAALSTHVKVVIAINTGVLPGLLNSTTLTNVKKFYTFDNTEFFTYPNFERKNRLIDITFDELDRYIY